MKGFNYQDYLTYQILKRREEIKSSGLSDVNESYKLPTNKVDKPHDKIFKIVLSDKKQVAQFINRILNLPEKLTEHDIERYSTEHIDYMFQESESDMVYKMKNKEIFFLIEHQRTIDYNMPKRILDYEIEIIREATKGKIMTKKAHGIPTVYPIVIYTGSRKWEVEKYIKECQELLTGADRIKLGEYYMVDVNDYTNEELEKDELFLSKILLLEKLNKEEELFNVLKQIVEKEKDKNNQSILRRIIAFIIKGKIPSEDIEILLKKLEKEEEDMVIEVVQKENERQRRIGVREGIKEGIKEGIQTATENIIIQMLKNKMSEKTIKKITNIDEEELKKIKEKF